MDGPVALRSVNIFFPEGYSSVANQIHELPVKIYFDAAPRFNDSVTKLLKKKIYVCITISTSKLELKLILSNIKFKKRRKTNMSDVVIT